MRKLLITTLTAAAACACSESTRTPAAPTEYTAPLQVQAAQPEGTAKNHGTHLVGEQENPPRDTRAQGQAIFKVAADRKSVDYKLIASNIENVFMAHIHCGVAGENGSIIVWLFPSTATAPGPTGTGRHDGVLAEGTFSAENVQVAADDIQICPGGVRAGNLEDVLARIEEGKAYVNVHTNDGVAPPNTGPGDFPGGEIRGQLDK